VVVRFGLCYSLSRHRAPLQMTTQRFDETFGTFLNEGIGISKHWFIGDAALSKRDPSED
jgi:hypothetical protein